MFYSKKYLFRFLEDDKSSYLPVGKHNHIPDSYFDPDQLQMGIEVEFEHTTDPEIAKAIAKDHLMENPKYYTYLKKMEDSWE